MGDGDGADDGQPEAAVVVDAGAVESLEGVEEAVDLLGITGPVFSLSA